MSWVKIKKKLSFWSVFFSYSTQQQTISRSDCDVWWKVGFIWQPAMTSSVVGLRRSAKALPKAKLAPRKGHGHCLVVCCWSDWRQLSEFQQNYYIWKICLASWWDHQKLQHLKLVLIKRKGPILLHDNACTSHHQCFKSWTNWAIKFCLICHILLTSSQLTTTSSSILTTFLRENTSTTSRRQKILSKSSLNPEAWSFALQE